MTETPAVDTAGDSSEGRPLEVYEWGGGIVAGLGLFLTPLVTGLPALYCMLKVQEEKPGSAIGIGIVLLVTTLFWAGFLFGEEVLALFTTGETTTTALGGLIFVGLVVVPLIALNLVLFFRR
jgi:hypothetical protein